MKSSCVNRPGSYDCDCFKGYEGNTCSDIDECLTKSHQCSEKEDCSNNDGSYNCECKKGYDQVLDGCEDIDECSSKSHDCQTGFICKNSIGSFWCDDMREMNVLVLNTFMSEKAVLISGESYTEPTFHFGHQTSVHGSCSLTFRNSLYVFGGIDEKQVSQLNGNRLERIGNLDFEFYHGACANLKDKYFYLCFSNDELRQCRFSLGATKEFHKFTKSSDRHGEISIAASTS